MYLIRKKPIIRPWQGDIYKEINIIQDVIQNATPEGENEWIINEVTYPYAIVLTQECDLEQDYVNRIGQEDNQDKYIPMILMAPAYLAESLKNGDHLTEYGQKMQRINSKEWDKVKKNENKRYHFLKSEINKNITDLVIDFKHFYTISRDTFYNKIMNQNYLASLTILHREVVSQRFSNFFSRIGIPNNVEDTKILTDSLCDGMSGLPST